MYHARYTTLVYMHSCTSLGTPTSLPWSSQHATRDHAGNGAQALEHALTVRNIAGRGVTVLPTSVLPITVVTVRQH